MSRPMIACCSSSSSSADKKLEALTNYSPPGCRVYDLYADYVLKNPFYEVEQTIQSRCELFDRHLYFTITGLHRRWGHPV